MSEVVIERCGGARRTRLSHARDSTRSPSLRGVLPSLTYRARFARAAPHYRHTSSILQPRLLLLSQVSFDSRRAHHAVGFPSLSPVADSPPSFPLSFHSSLSSISFAKMATLPASLISSITQRTPLRFTPTSNSQPYLPLPHPTLKLALTLPRPEDLPLQLETLNHAQVWPWLQGPPYPYERNDAEWWNASEVTRWETWVAGWEEELEGGEWKRKQGKAGEGCPLGVLRVAREEMGEMLGEGVWVGDLGIRRWAYEDTPEEGGERARMVKENEARAVGDENLLWTFGCASHCHSPAPCAR